MLHKKKLNIVCFYYLKKGIFVDLTWTFLDLTKKRKFQYYARRIRYHASKFDIDCFHRLAI